MIQPFEQMQKFGQDNLDAAMRALGAFSNTAQAIAAESADFAKKTFEHNSATAEKLFGVRTLDKAVEIQSEFVQGTYESIVSQATKMGSLYSALATETLKPYEGLMKKVTA